MGIREIAKIELIKMGVPAENALVLSNDMFFGFKLIVAEKYARQKFKEGALAQKHICCNTSIIAKHCSALHGLDIAKAIRHEIENAPEPAYK